MLFTNFSFFFSDSTKDKLSSSVATKKDEIEVDLSTIGEDFDDVAFDNHAYKSMPFPGLEVASKQNYENVEPIGDCFYENVLNLSNYENVPNANYENVPGKVVKPVPGQVSTYQNVTFNGSPGDDHLQLFYQNVEFGRSDKCSKKSEKNNNCLTKSDDIPEYENFDFEEESVYQNMIVTEQKKMIPASMALSEQQVSSSLSTNLASLVV